MSSFVESALVKVEKAADKISDKCPFCKEDKHDFPNKKGRDSDKVSSKPSQLACAKLAKKGTYDYTTANHHLISAKQCYARLKRLVRMGNLVGYDINDPPNGIGLPTVANNLRYELNGEDKRKYGKLDNGEKRVVAFSVMKHAKAQWHVGHHAFSVELPDDWADEKDDTERGHTVQYDEGVIRRLLKLLNEVDQWELCKDEDESNDFKSEMDALSKAIHGKLDCFGRDAPKESSPFFVSQLAFQYAKQAAETPKKRSKRKHEDDEDAMQEDDDDPPPPRKKQKT